MVRTWILDGAATQNGDTRWLNGSIVIHFRAPDVTYRVALVREKASRKLFAIVNPTRASFRELQRHDFEDLYVRCIAAHTLGASLTVEIDL